MCLTITLPEGKKRPVAKTAKKDMVVYKFLLTRKYKKGAKKIPANLIEGEAPYYDLIYKKGMHYYQTGKKFSYRKDRWLPGVIHIDEGLHAYTTKENDRLVQMIVPKGSKYYISTNGNEIVADNLIWPA